MPLEKLGPYRIERQLGRGGMGAVYAATDETNGARVAVKVLAEALASEENFRVRFQGEIESLIKVRHPHIVEIFGYGEQDGHYFFSMELVEGQSLYEEQRGGRQFTWREVALLGLDICAALKHAHDHGIVHRDLKPANLLLDRIAGVKLSDFGIAKLFGGTNVTSDGGVIGTADYMAPEQAEGKQVTSRCDLYSLGGVFYTLLTGRPPLVGKSLPDLLHLLRYTDPQPVRALAPRTPVEFERLIQELLAKSPQQRTPTAVAVMRRLETILQTPDDDLPSKISAAGATAPVISGLTLPGVEGAGTFQWSQDLADQRTAPDIQSRTSGAPITRPLPDLTLPEPKKSAASEGQATSPGMPRTASAGAQFTAGAETNPGTSSRNKAPPTTKESQFVVVDEQERRRLGNLPIEEDIQPAWPKVLGLAAVLALLAIAIWFALQPPSTESLYERVLAAAESDDRSRLVEVEGDIQAMLELVPEAKIQDELRGYQEEIELYRLEKRFDRQLRRPQVGDFLPVEQAYLEAMHLVQLDLDRGANRLKAVVDLFQGQSAKSDRTRQCVELARRQLRRLESSLDASLQLQLKSAESQLIRADQLFDEAPQESLAIWKAIIELYGEKPWASAAVARAQASLARANDKGVKRDP